MNSHILIIDTGCANIASLDFAIKRLGYQAVISAAHQDIINADKVFLPGVGTAKEAMKNLNERCLVDTIRQLTQPVLGICLGMQLLASISKENQSKTTCLNIIDACVEPLKSQGLPTPHMGWNSVKANCEQSLFANIPKESFFYFVHSYGIKVSDFTIGETHYGSPFSAAIQLNNFYGVQFHPERSSKQGAQLIKNFIEM